MTEQALHEQPLAVARRRWKEASGELSSRKLLSDMELDLKLLEQAKHFPVWRGLVALGGSWLLPQLPVLMGQPDAVAIILFQVLGGLSTGAAVWFLAKDGMLWWRWMRARQALKKGDYRAPSLVRALQAKGLELRPLDRDGEVWRQLETWSKKSPQIHAVWQKWNKALAPVREGDARAMEEAVFAITALQDLKGSR